MSGEDNRNPIRPNFPWWILTVVVAVVVSIGILILEFNWELALALLKRPNFKETFGQIGDIFGFSNAVFSGLAFILLALGVWMQREELKDAKKLLKEQKKITAGQEAALKKQNEATERQMFENTFFKLLDDYNEIVISLKCTNINSLFNNRYDFNDTSEYAEQFDGKKVFDEVSKLIDLVFDVDLLNYTDLLPTNNPKPVKNEQDFDEKYEVINFALNGLLDRYFRTVYNILKFISLANFRKNNKKFYSNILRAQMTNKETKVISFNIASKYGREKFKILTEELNFLKHCYNANGEISLLSKVIKAKAFK